MHADPELTPAVLAELREMLLDDIARLERRLAHLKANGTVALDQTVVGRVSRMDALMNQGLSQASDNRAVTDLLAAREALGRIDENDYGRCSECGSAIPLARLEAMPETPHCARCA